MVYFLSTNTLSLIFFFVTKVISYFSLLLNLCYTLVILSRYFIPWPAITAMAISWRCIAEKNYNTITGSQENHGFALAVVYASQHCDRKLFSKFIGSCLSRSDFLFILFVNKKLFIFYVVIIAFNLKYPNWCK